ncbi:MULTISPECIES: protein phosphatase 2C domain-containing protein [unclassified Nocardiopsis]|uniref:protein phosphatase 2C domain-containing protein n=1 Tax=unclassified Nocardiopsis TaxID=2649073 RepID=UPI0013598C9C|nr:MULTISPECIES: protein phosphatase 2C domain-containing protein [unclassified Nocardiopsis]
MPFLIATDPGDPERPNEDFAAATATSAVVLDGATAPPGVDTGCSHGVAWYTRRLGALLLAGADAGLPLREALAGAIASASALHADTCDLENQESPSATVVAVRAGEGELEYLVLSDSVLLAPEGEGVRVVADTRLDDLRNALTRPDRPPAPVRTLRNVPGGFWTAGARVRAADEALTGTLAADRCVAMTDGAGRAVEVFGDLDWGQAFALVSDKGPRALVDRVRDLERADPEGLRHPRGKVRDDATVLAWSAET